jgi:mannose-6-phosphate isomerase
MGTHPNGPSLLHENENISLSSWLENHSNAVGYTPEESNELPFMLKILSIQTALSIQVHPNKALAFQLHQKQPHLYKDPNHKPEMSIALTPFEALCGFRPLSEIYYHLRTYPEFAEMIGERSKYFK